MKLARSSHRQTRGMAVIVILALLSIMLICVGAGVRSINRLHTELKLLDQRQVQRWTTLNTNQPPNLPAPANTSP